MDKLLDPKETAEMLGVTKHYVYTNPELEPLKIRLSPKRLRFSRDDLLHLIETKKTATPTAPTAAHIVHRNPRYR